MHLLVRKPRLHGVDFIALMVCLSTSMDISYLNRIVPHLGTIKIGFYLFTLALELLFLLRRKIFITRQELVLLLAAACVFFSTLLNGGSLISCASVLAPALIACLALIICRDAEETNRVLNVWCSVLFLLLLADLASFVLFPHGLYKTVYYTRNWFLGYKTNRLMHTFPLLTFYIYKTICKSGTTNTKCVLLALLVLLDVSLSRGAAGTLAVAAYALVLFLLIPKQKAKAGQDSLVMKMLSKPTYFISAYALITVLLIFLQNQRIIQRIMTMFEKSESLGERTIIWNRILDALSGHWLLGLGAITSEQYLRITGFVLNAHNVILTYLVNGGVLGLLCLGIAVIMMARRIHGWDTYVISFYIFINLCIGITSAALAFCPYFFAAIILPFTQKQGAAKSPPQNRLRLHSV
jgi:O-antigen ligase